MANIQRLSTKKTIYPKDKDLRNAINVLRNHAERIHNNPYNSSFTDHGITHSDRMIEICNGLLVGNNHSDLNDIEKFLLVACIYLHDIGMQLTNEAVLESFCQYSIEKWGIKVSGNKSEIKDFVRRNHHLLSSYWIETNNLTDNFFCSNYCQLAPYASLIVRSHGLNDFCEYDDYCKTYGHHVEPINLQLLCALLCICDPMDCSSARIDFNKTLYSNLDAGSIIHWYKHYYVDSCYFDKRVFRILYSFPSLSEYENKVYKKYFSYQTKFWIEHSKRQYSEILNNSYLSFDIFEYFSNNNTKEKLNSNLYLFIEEELANIEERSNRAISKIIVCICVHENKVLMVQRKKSDESLTWMFPSGHKRRDDGMSSAIYIMNNETGISCDNPNYLGKRLQMNTGAVCYYYTLQYVNGEISNNDFLQNEKVEWVPIEEYDQLVNTDIYAKAREYIINERHLHSNYTETYPVEDE